MSLLCLLAGSAVHAEPVEPAALPDGRALLERAWDNLYGESSVQSVVISSRFRDREPFEYRVRTLQKLQPEPRRALICFEQPGDIRGTSILTIDRSERGNDVIVYLPAFGTTRRVGDFQRGDPVFGTDLAYEDLLLKTIEDYDTRTLGVGEHAGQRCQRIEAVPRAGVRSVYERMVSCVEPERAVVLRTEFFRAGALHKELVIEPDSVREVDGRFVPHVVHLERTGGVTKTRVELREHDFRPMLPEALFTESGLERCLARVEPGAAWPDAPERGGAAAGP